MTLLQEAKIWIVSIPKFARFKNNDSFCLRMYSKHVLKKDINVDFELKRPEVSVGTQILYPNYQEHYFTFNLDKLGTYNGKKFGWTGNYVGFNKPGMQLCLEKKFDLRVISKNSEYYFHTSVLEHVVENKWVVYSTRDRPQLYYIPISLSRKEHYKSHKLEDFIIPA